MKWISVKDGLPTDKDNNKFFLFAQWREDRNDFICSDLMTWSDIKDWRENQLKHNYTHYLKSPKISPSHKHIPTHNTHSSLGNYPYPK